LFFTYEGASDTYWVEFEFLPVIMLLD